MTRSTLSLSAAFTAAISTSPASAHPGAGAVHLLTQADHIAVLGGTAVVVGLSFLIWRLARN